MIVFRKANWLCFLIALAVFGYYTRSLFYQLRDNPSAAWVMRGPVDIKERIVVWLKKNHSAPHDFKRLIEGEVKLLRLSNNGYRDPWSKSQVDLIYSEKNPRGPSLALALRRLSPEQCVQMVRAYGDFEIKNHFDEVGLAQALTSESYKNVHKKTGVGNQESSIGFSGIEIRGYSTGKLYAQLHSENLVELKYSEALGVLSRFPSNCRGIDNEAIDLILLGIHPLGLTINGSQINYLGKPRVMTQASEPVSS